MKGARFRKEEVEFRGVGSDFSSKVGSCSKEARSGHVTDGAMILRVSTLQAGLATEIPYLVLYHGADEVEILHYLRLWRS
jgi:hypothetical protein